MLGCVVRLAAILLLAVAGVGGWLTRDLWGPPVLQRLGLSAPPAAAAAAWEPLSPEGAARARTALESLRRRDGPVYVNVRAGDLASFALDSVLRRFGRDVQGPAALAGDDGLHLRATVRVADLGDAKSLGPLAGVLEGPQPLELRGRLDVVRPGLGRFRVDRIKIKDITLPSAAIPRLLRRLAIPARDAAVGPDAVPVRLPPEIADARVRKGRVTLYKAVP